MAVFICCSRQPADVTQTWLQRSVALYASEKSITSLERAMIRERAKAGLHRARAHGKRLDGEVAPF